ncbi:helix-turn-helix domain-containing protein [Undibacterium sp. TC9W]|uniref:helix-turn-helix domain-containing protein n=1 Tax=Undibacterium sp. TC9W TaxID=3413053 RepID=UPI003BF12995
MSNVFSEVLFTIGARLAEERDRLGYSQKALAAILEKTSRTQIKYELGETTPDAAYLSSLDKLGADIYYIITGKRSSNKIEKDELEVIEGYRKLDIRGKAGVLGMISGMVPATTEPKIQNVFHGGVGQTVQGNVTTPQTFIFGKDK